MPAQPLSRGQHGGNGIHMGLGVPDHTPLADPLAADLELGLDQQNRLSRTRSEQGPQGRQHQHQRDERQICHGQIGPWILRTVEIGRLKMTEIGAFPEHQPRIRAQAPGRLAVTHIDPIDPAGPSLQEAIGETTRGDAAIQADPIGHDDREDLQGGHELFPPAGDEPGR